MHFEWDRAKAEDNIAKHGVSFGEATTALRDPLSTTGVDPDHSFGEERFITFGVSTRGRLLVVAHTDHEQINKNELRTGVERYVRLAKELLG